MADTAYVRRLHPRLRIWRFQWFGWHRGWPHFGIYLSGWFYFTNHSFPSEKRCWMRIGEWRCAFGGHRGA